MMKQDRIKTKQNRINTYNYNFQQFFRYKVVGNLIAEAEA